MKEQEKKSFFKKAVFNKHRDWGCRNEFHSFICIL